MGIKKYKSIIKKKKKEHDKVVFKSLIDSYITHDEFVFVNNAIKEYDNMIKDIKNLKTSTFNKRF